MDFVGTLEHSGEAGVKAHRHIKRRARARQGRWGDWPALSAPRRSHLRASSASAEMAAGQAEKVNSAVGMRMSDPNAIGRSAPVLRFASGARRRPTETPYTVSKIAVDVTAKNAVAAKANAMAEAEKRGLNTVLRRIVPFSFYPKLPDLQPQQVEGAGQRHLHPQGAIFHDALHRDARCHLQRAGGEAAGHEPGHANQRGAGADDLDPAARDRREPGEERGQRPLAPGLARPRPHAWADPCHRPAAAARSSKLGMVRAVLAGDAERLRRGAGRLWERAAGHRRRAEAEEGGQFVTRLAGTDGVGAHQLRAERQIRRRAAQGGCAARPPPSPMRFWRIAGRRRRRPRNKSPRRCDMRREHAAPKPPRSRESPGVW